MARAMVVFSNGDTFEVEGKSAGEVINEYVGEDFVVFSTEYRKYTHWSRTLLVKVYDLEPLGSGE